MTFSFLIIICPDAALSESVHTVPCRDHTSYAVGKKLREVYYMARRGHGSVISVTGISVTGSGMAVISVIER